MNTAIYCRKHLVYSTPRVHMYEFYNLYTISLKIKFIKLFIELKNVLRKIISCEQMTHSYPKYINI